MWRLLAIGLCLAACAEHGKSPDAEDGQLVGVQRGGGFCQASWACNGSLRFTDSSFTAVFNGTTIATGSVALETMGTIDLAVAQIPPETPATIPEPQPGGCDAGPTTYDVVVRGDAHSYTHQCALGQLAALSQATGPVMSAIATCTPSALVTLTACTRTN